MESNIDTSQKLTYSGETITSMETEKGTIILLGTAHISEDSTREVEEVIRDRNPSIVCVELDKNRYRALNEAHSWKNLDIYQIIKENKVFLLLSSLVLSAYQKRLGIGLGSRPGDEMRAAVRVAKEHEIPIATIDRDISLTLSRAWRKTRFWGKSKLLSVLAGSAFSREELSKEEIEKLKQRSALDDMMTEMANFLPSVKEVLINERDEYLSIKLWKAITEDNAQQNREGKDASPVVLAVVGAGHVPGMVKLLQEFNSQKEDKSNNLEKRLEEISEIPAKGFLSKAFPWIVAFAVLALLISGFIFNGWEGGLRKLLYWVLINGSLSAIGSIIALAHPLTIVSSIISAPITSMNPTIGVGMVTGLLESFLRKPRVQDFENLGEDITGIKGFYRNRITRILLVFLFSSIGSAIGTFIALPLIFP